MPTVAIDVRGGGPGATRLLGELRRFDGLTAPRWRAWSRLAAPHAVHALGGRLPAIPGCPGVVTLTAATNATTLRRASLVLCPSQAAMASAAQRSGARPERLRVVPLAAALAPGHALDRPAALALALVDGDGDGGPLRAAFRRAAPHSDLRVLDAEPGERALAAAELLVDLRSGVLFGGLALAALARGVPVVAARGGAVAEAVGDAAVVVADPADPAALAGAVSRALTERAALAAAGRERASLFTWAGTAEATVMAYRELW